MTFKVGTNLNMAQVLVQNRVALAQPILPDVVKQIGVSVKKRSPDLMFIVNLYSPNGALRSVVPEQLRPDPGQGRAVAVGRASAT